MPWARFDDHMPTHRKVRPLSDAAFRLWVSAVCWCNANHTDGAVFYEDLTYVSDVKRPAKAAEELVTRGLWEAVDGGWIVHDFHDYNPTKDQVDARREQKTERQRRWRQGLKDADVDASTDTPTDASVDPAPVPSRPVPTTSSGSNNPIGQTATPADEPKRRPRPGAPLEPDAFERFWHAYPRKVAKGAAVKAWNQAIAAGADTALVADCAALYAMERKMQDPQYTKHPATWLNGKCWEDEPDPAYTPPAPVPYANGRPGNDYGSDAHMDRFIARHTTGETW